MYKDSVRKTINKKSANIGQSKKCMTRQGPGLELIGTK